MPRPRQHPLRQASIQQFHPLNRAAVAAHAAVAGPWRHNDNSSSSDSESDDGKDHRHHPTPTHHTTESRRTLSPSEVRIGILANSRFRPTHPVNVNAPTTSRSAHSGRALTNETPARRPPLPALHNQPTLPANANAAPTTSRAARSDMASANEQNNIAHPVENCPPSPWGNKCKAKINIICELKNESSDIHLLPTEGRAKRIYEKYASQYDEKKCINNLKRLLKQYEQREGPFSEKNANKHMQNKVEQWYTSAKKVSVGYKLLHELHMDPIKHRVHNMTAEEIWQLHPKFKCYPIADFKKHNKNMIILTRKKRKQIKKEEKALMQDWIAFPRKSTTGRNVPFWDTHIASSMLKEDESDGTAKKISPKALWESREEYQEFPLAIFRKHIYQERSKQLSAAFWQHTRNKVAQKLHAEEVGEMKAEWHDSREEKDLKDLVGRCYELSVCGNDL